MGRSAHAGQSGYVAPILPRSYLDFRASFNMPHFSIFLVLQAGEDTVSTALAATLFYLSRNSESYKRLKSEIRTSFSTIDSICQGRALSHCHYPRACLDEAMRLSPPAAGFFWRETTGSGALIDGVLVPAGYDVGVGIYALHHNQRYFPDSYAFRPECFLLVETSEQRRYTISQNAPSRSMLTSQDIALQRRLRRSSWRRLGLRSLSPRPAYLPCEMPRLSGNEPSDRKDNVEPRFPARGI